MMFKFVNTFDFSHSHFRILVPMQLPQRINCIMDVCFDFGYKQETFIKNKALLAMLLLRNLFLGKYELYSDIQMNLNANPYLQRRFSTIFH